MVVLAASVCTKGGKAVVSRQFVEMPRSRIEGLLAAFPKLIDPKHQHTFVETDAVRYVYQPLDDLYMVLVTNKSSNILSDIETVHLFSRAVSESCKTYQEREIAKNAFELIFAFDEIVALGHAEGIDISALRTILEMDSAEERIQAEIEKSKEREAKEQLKLKMKMMELQKREAAKRPPPPSYGASSSSSSYGGGGSNYGSSSMGGYGGSGGGGSGSYSNGMQSGYSGMSQNGYGGGNNVSNISSSSINPSASDNVVYKTQEATRSSTKGMQLGRKVEVVDTIKAEEGIRDVLPAPAVMGGRAQPVSAAVTSPASVLSPSHGVSVLVEEKVSVVAKRDGGLQSMEVKGELTLRVTDPAKSLLRLALKLNQEDPAIQYKNHPNVDKGLFSAQSILGLKDPAKPFPLNQAVGVLKWRFISQDERKIPLSISCWPTPSGRDECDVTVEYELLDPRITLRNVMISIPYGTNAPPPAIKEVDGDYQVDSGRRMIHWSLPHLDRSNASGVMEFAARTGDTNSFFPVSASFTSEQSYCDVTVLGVSNSQSGAPIEYVSQITMMSENYSVV